MLLTALTWGDGADHHRLLAARHEAEAQHRVSPHLHQAGGGGHAVQVDLLQGAALRHLAGGQGGGHRSTLTCQSKEISKKKKK